MSIKIAIVGSGVYGSYISKKLAHTDHNISIFERGSRLPIKPHCAELPQVIGDQDYGGFSEGRRFGLGGTSRVWGGQLFELDPSELGYSDNLFYQYFCNRQTDRRLTSGTQIKKGIWLYPWWKRSIPSKNHSIIYGVKVVDRINLPNGKTKLVTEKHGAFVYDIVFLCAGAFENCEVLNYRKYKFSDHVSSTLGTIKAENFPKRLYWKFGRRGLTTARMHFPELDFGHYVHFVFNYDTEFVFLMRRLIKSQTYSLREIDLKRLWKEVGNLIYGFVVRREFFPWRESNVKVILDMEIEMGWYDAMTKSITLLDNGSVLEERLSIVKSRLAKVGLNIEFEKSDFSRYEDIYHPHNILPPIDFESYLTYSQSCYRIDTGLLSSCGATNPTGVLFKLIDRILDQENLS